MTTLRIALDIAPATETHCTSRDALCRFARFSGANFHCDAFGVAVVRSSFSHPERLPQCLAAEQSPWTEQRPTEAGEYELSLKPESRIGDTPAVAHVIVKVRSSGRVTVSSTTEDFVLFNINIQDEMFDGALWRKRQPSADPFAKEPTP